ncbi:MAG: DUF4012 domain-containing protein [Patescibacteria group bacterium]
MKVPALTAYQSKDLPLVLIVDKIGVIGEELAKSLSADYLVVFVSPEIIDKLNPNIIHIPFNKKIPQVPDNKYSKIFIVDDGQVVTRESAFSFIQIARDNNAQLFFIGSLRNIDVEHADEITSSYTNSKVLIFGDLFDKNIFFDKNTSISKYILQARKNSKIEVEGNGLSLNFPISFSDTIKLIVKASYLEITQKVILLFYPHPITDISLANTFQKINPDIKVDFIKEGVERKIYLPLGGQHAISKYELERKIKELELEDKSNRELRVVNKEKGKERNFLKPIFFFLLGCLFLALLPFMTTAAYSLLGYQQIQEAKTSAENGNFDKALEKAKNSKTFFEIAGKTSSILNSEASLAGQAGKVEGLVRKIETGEDLSSATVYLLEGLTTLKNIYKGESNDPKRDFSKASNSLKSSIALIQKIKTEENLPSDFKEKFEDIDPFIEMFSNSSEILPNILGFDTEKTYLVLFQNNMELRPGGGFIGSYGILKIKNAKITSFKITDVYQTDGQLKEHVEPPFAIRRFLPSVHWYLRDSNFDPDFINSAISAASIYQTETKNKVDGVIGVDLSFAKNIVSAIGPVNVTDYKKTIDESNLYQITQEASEKNFFPGSTQKKDFLSALAGSIAQKLQAGGKVPYLLLAQKTGQSIREKHVLFAFQDTEYQNIFTANNWSSSLWDNRSKEGRSINDYFGLSEANLGVNKVNYYISRSVSKKTIISDSGKVSSRTTVAIKNNSKEGDKFGGNYKNYMRLILPKGSKITSIQIDNKEIETNKAVTDYYVYESKSFKPPKGLEVDQTEEMNKSIFGFLVIVPRQSVKTVVVNYDLPFTISKNDKAFKYSLKVYKQPGVDSFPFELTFSLPEAQEIVGKSTFSKDITTDQDLQFLISQK